MFTKIKTYLLAIAVVSPILFGLNSNLGVGHLQGVRHLDLRNTAQEENYPGHLEVSYNSSTKKLSITPQNVPSNIKPYLALQLKDDVGRNLLTVNRKNNQTEIEANNLGAIRKSTISGYELKDIVELPPSKDYILYQLDQDNRVHSTKLSGGFWNTKSVIIPTTYLTNPGVDKFTNNTIDECIFAKPNFDGNNYAWKGDMSFASNGGIATGYDSKFTTQIRLKFDKFPNNGEIFYEYLSEKLQVTMAFKDKKIVFTQKYDTKVKTMTLSKELTLQKWHVITLLSQGTTPQLYIDGLYEGTTGAGNYNFSNSQTKFHLKKRSGDWAIADVMIWNKKLNNAEIEKFAKKLPTPYDASIVGFFDMDENSGTQVLNSKPNSNVIATLSGDCQKDWVVGGYQYNEPPKTGKILNLCDNQTYGELNNINLANKSFTIEFKSRRSTNNTNDFIVTQGYGGTNTFLHLGYRANNQFAFAFYGNDLNTNTKVTDNDWHHWACTYDVGTKIRRIYQNGVLVAEDKKVKPYKGTGTLNIGVSKMTGSDFFQGHLDELRIWSKARTQSEVQNYMDKSVPKSEKNLLAYLPFDKLSNDKTFNEVTNAHDATLKGFGQNTPLVAASAPTCQNQNTVVKINPTTGNVVNTCSGFGKISGLDLKKTSFTIEFLARCSRTKSLEAIFSQGNLWGAFHPDSKLSISFGNNHLYTESLKDIDKWNHYAIVYNASTNMRKIYQNGILVAKDNKMINSYNQSGVFNFGNKNGQYPFQGQIDEFRIWKTTRSQEDIKNNMTVSLGGQPANLFFYSKFEKLENGAAYNEVSKKYDLTGIGLFLNKVDDKPCEQPPIPKINPQTGKVINFCTGGFNGERYIDGIYLVNKSFTIEFLARTFEQREHTILSEKNHGYPNKKNELLNIVLKPNNQLHFGFWGNDLASKPDTVGLRDWNHWALVYDHTIKKRKIYKNGVLIATDLKSIDPYKGNGRIHLGYMPDNSKPFKGQLDELRIWKTVRTQDDIQKNMEKPLVGKPNDLLAYSKFETLSNYMANNEVGNNIPCKLATLTDITDDPCSNTKTLPFNTGTVLELCNGSFEFDVNSMKSFTITAMVQSNSRDFLYLGKKGLRVDLDLGYVRINENRGASNDYYLSESFQHSGKDWVHVAYTFDQRYYGGTLKAYINGKLIKTSRGRGQMSGLDFGGTWKIRNFTGKIDQLRFWSTVRSQQQIADDAFQDFGPTNHLEHTFRFNGLSNGETRDYHSRRMGKVTNGTIAKADGKVCQPTQLPKLNTGKVLNLCNQQAYESESPINLANQSFTIEFLAKRSKTTGEDYVLGLGTKHEKNKMLHVGFDGDDVRMGFLANTLYANGKGNDQWNHWAFVYDHNAKRRIIYRNGKEIGADKTDPFIGQGKLIFGRIEINVAKHGFDGQLDEFRIWKSVRSEQEIKDNMTKSLATVPKELAVYYKFENLNNDKAYNEAAKKEDITLKQAFLSPSNAAPCPAPPSLSKVATGNALNFCSTADEATIKNVKLNNSFTIEFLAKRSQTNHEAQILQQGTGNAQLSIGFKKNNAPNFAWGSTELTTAMSYLGNTKKLNHWAFVYNAKAKKRTIYLNGVAIAADQQAIPAYNGTENLTIGKGFEGQLDEFRVWNVARSGSEIKNNANKTLTTIPNTLLTYSKFEQLNGGNLYNEVTQKADIATSAALNDLNKKPCQDLKGLQLKTGNVLNLCNRNGGKLQGKILLGGDVTVEFLSRKSDAQGTFLRLKGEALENGNWNEKNFLTLKVHNTELEATGMDWKADRKVPIDNKWHHWAITITHYNNFTRYEIFKDGKSLGLFDTDKAYKMNYSNNTLEFGDFTGQIDELRIWDGKRSNADIRVNAFQSLKTLPSNLRVYSKFEKLQGGNAYDEVSKKYNLIFKSANLNKVTDAPCSNAMGFQQISSITPTTGNTLSFCNSDVAEIAPIDWAKKSFTVEFLAKRNKAKKQTFLIQQRTGGKNRKLHIGFRGNDKFTFAFNGNDLPTPTAVKNLSEWNHWACVYDHSNKTRRIYQNGSLLAEDKNVVPYEGTGKLLIGENFEGQLDELRIWKTVRTEKEIQDNATKALATVSNDLFFYSKFEKLTDSKAYNEVTKKEDIACKRLFINKLDEDVCYNSKGVLSKQAIYLDGKDTYIASDQPIDLTNKSFTVEFWAEKENDGTVFSHGDPTKKDEYIAFKATEGGLHHYTYVYDRISKIFIQYIDGTPKKSSLITNTYKGTTAKIILGRNKEGGTNFDAYKGKLDEVRVWDRVFTPTQVKEKIYLGKFGANTPNLLLYYDFETFSGKTIPDVTNKNNGQLSFFGNPRYALASVDLKLVMNTVKEVNQGVNLKPIQPTLAKTAINFDGNDDHITLPEINLRNSFTIAFWAKNARPNDYGFVFSQGPVNNGVKQRKLLRIGFWNDNRFYFDFFGEDLRTSAKYTDTDWHHWTMTYDASTKKQAIYRDGKEVAARIAIANFAGSGSIRIGASIQDRSGNPRFMFKGGVDDLIVISTALSNSSDITNLSKGIIPINQKQQSYYFDFNEGKGSEINSKLKTMKGVLKNMDLNNAWILRK